MKKKKKRNIRSRRRIVDFTSGKEKGFERGKIEKAVSM